MKKKSKTILNILIVLLLGIMAFSGYKLFEIQKAAKEIAEQYEKLEQTIQKTEEENDYQLSASEKYQSVYEVNNNFVGWVYIPDTPLNYPVLQTKDYPEYYLRRDFYKKYSFAGVPFMDFKCTADESDNIILYSHNMLDGTMFSVVEKYSKKSFWEEHPYIGFDTLNGYGTYEVAICARVDLTNIDFNYTDTVDFATEQEFDDYIAKVKALADYETDVSLEFGDKLLLLSTCEYQYEEGRYIVIAKKISDEDLSLKAKE